MAQRGFRPTPQQRRRHQNEGMNQSILGRIGAPKPPTAPKTPNTKPGLGGQAAPKPAPAAPVGKPRTPDSQYHGTIDRITRREESRLGQLEGQEQAVQHEFGIEDPTNPFSRAEGLKRAFLARQKAASASLASQGQGYSGAHERALSRTRRDEEQSRAELRRTFDLAIGQIGAEKAGVKFATEEERAQAFEDWLARTPESEATPPISPGGNGVVTPLPRLTGERDPGPGGWIPQTNSTNRRSTRGATAVSGTGNANSSPRLQELRGMLRKAKASGDTARVKVIQNRIKVVKSR